MELVKLNHSEIFRGEVKSIRWLYFDLESLERY